MFGSAFDEEPQQVLLRMGDPAKHVSSAEHAHVWLQQCQVCIQREMHSRAHTHVHTQWCTCTRLNMNPLAPQIRIVESPSVRDAFASELFRLSPPHLKALSLRGSGNLRSLVLSPLGSCPALESADLSGCASLGYVMVQSASLKALDLSSCPSLTKVLRGCQTGGTDALPWGGFVVAQPVC